MTPSLSVNVGDKFHHLTLLAELPRLNRMRQWRVRCDCGNVFDTLQKNFLSGGKRKSCGCTNRKFMTHGKTKAPEYRHWINIITRTENPNTPFYGYYGGRGIRVCDRWRSDFMNFYNDMGPRPTPHHSVDRIDGDGHYEPGNCRWATRKEQQRNLDSNHLVKVKGVAVTLAEAAENAPVPYNTVLYRLKRGWRVKDAVALPQQKGRRP